MADGAYRRRLAMIDQNSVAGAFISNDGLQIPTQAARPVSWHPASHMAPQQHYQPSYPVQQPNINAQYQMYDFSPTPAVYSGYTSPSSTFSPLSAPDNGYEQPQYFQNQQNTYNTNPNYSAPQQPNLCQATQNFAVSSGGNMDPSMYSHFDWNNFAIHGFEKSTTAPPTPENFLPIQHPDPSFPAEESIPYHPLADDEPEGEELIGMGLYDTPEVAKTPSLDPHLDNYRSLMMSQLAGSRYQRPESAGKGLKLEETWTPPSEDEDEDEDDDERDGEGEDDDEPVAVQQNAQNVTTSLSYDRNGWL